jgi:hypothetical protein
MFTVIGHGNHRIYGHTRCIYTVLANPKHNGSFDRSGFASNLLHVGGALTVGSIKKLILFEYNDTSCELQSCSRGKTCFKK